MASRTAFPNSWKPPPGPKEVIVVREPTVGNPLTAWRSISRLISLSEIGLCP